MTRVTTFKLKPHLTERDVQVIEVWAGEVFVATITPGDLFVGCRVITKHTISTSRGIAGELRIEVTP